jgi:gliding motility-associated-like protein
MIFLFPPLFSITYIVEASSPNGCAAVDSVVIKAFAQGNILVPRAFTPGGEHNNLLHAIPIAIREFRSFTVFNRWGQEVFMTGNSAVGWDGRFDGRKQPMGTYVWAVEGVDYSGRLIEGRGTVILIR